MKNIHYFRKELDYLHKMREIFVNKYPKLAPFLSHNSNDPDVERIIESLALLTSKIHEELDGNIPLIAESLINILAPNYTNSLPSMCIQDFALKPESKECKVFIPRHTSLKSTPINQVQCEFKTIYDVCLHPLKISDMSLTNEGKQSVFCLDIVSTNKFFKIADMDIHFLQIYLGSEVYSANTLLLWLLCYLQEIVIVCADTLTSFKIPCDSLETTGFDKNESMFSNGDVGFSAFRLLQELLFLPEKFAFVRIKNLEILKECQSEKMTVKFIFKKELPKDTLPKANQFSLFSTPIVNLFSTQAEPILTDHTRNGYRIFIDRAHLNAYSVIQVLKVKAHNSDSGRRILKNYNSFERFEFVDKGNDFYAISNKQDANGEHYKEITIYSNQSRRETLSIDVLCSNNNLPNGLQIGSINEIVGYQDVLTRNLMLPTKSQHRSIDNATLWDFIATLSFNYQSITHKESFLALLHTYSFNIDKPKNLYEIISESLQKIESKPAYNVNGFITLRGMQITLYIDDSKFYCLGEAYKIGLVLAHFFSSFVSINSFCEVSLCCTTSNTSFSYSIVYGNKVLL